MFRKLSFGLAISLACSTVLGADAPVSTPSAADIPVSAFCNFPKISNIKISPDGKYLAVVMADDKTGEQRKTLVILTADQPHKATASFSTIGDELISNFWWVSDERVIVSAAIQTGSFDPPFGDGRLYGVNVDGTQKKQLLPVVTEDMRDSTLSSNMHGHDQVVFFYDLLHRFPDDPKHVLINGGQYEGVAFDQPTQAYLLDVYTGETRQVLESPAADAFLVADSKGQIRLAAGTNTATGEPEAFYRPDGHTLDWANLSKLYEGGDPAEADSYPAGFMPDDKHVYWYAPTPGGTHGLYDLDPETLALKPIFTDPDFDVSDEIGGFEWSTTRKIIGVETMPGLPKVQILDPDDLKAQYLAQFYDAFPGQHVVITSNSRDHSRMIVAVHSDKNPGEFYLFDTKSKQAQFLFASKPAIDPGKMSPMLPIEFKARDGLALRGYITIPAASNGKNLPMIMLPHGGPHGVRDEWGFDSEVQLFASRGYAVLQLNYRGSGGYGSKFQDVGYSNWGTTMQDDLADGVQWAIKQGYADPNRICIYGGSYGGYAAVENPIRYPDLYKCTVGYAGVYDLTLQGKSGDTHHYAGGKRALNIFHADDVERQKQYSPAYNADKLKLPVFIVYSGHDKRVVPKNSEELMSAMDKLGKKYDVMYEPNEMHGYYKPEHREELYTRMLAFFDKYIGPGAVKAGAASAAGTTASKP